MTSIPGQREGIPEEARSLHIVFPPVASSSGHGAALFRRVTSFVINVTARNGINSRLPFVRAKIRLSFYIEILTSLPAFTRDDSVDVRCDG